MPRCAVLSISSALSRSFRSPPYPRNDSVHLCVRLEVRFQSWQTSRRLNRGYDAGYMRRSLECHLLLIWKSKTWAQMRPAEWLRSKTPLFLHRVILNLFYPPRKMEGAKTKKKPRTLGQGDDFIIFWLSLVWIEVETTSLVFLFCFPGTVTSILIHSSFSLKSSFL